MNFGDFPWNNLYAMAGVISVSLGGFSWLMTQIMRRNFVSHQDHERLGARIGGVETQLRTTATKKDLEGVEARLRPVEQGVAVIGERVDGLRDSVRGVQESSLRTEHQVSLLREYLMTKERPQ